MDNIPNTFASIPLHYSLSTFMIQIYSLLFQKPKPPLPFDCRNHQNTSWFFQFESSSLDDLPLRILANLVRLGFNCNKNDHLVLNEHNWCKWFMVLLARKFLFFLNVTMTLPRWCLVEPWPPK